MASCSDDSLTGLDSTRCSPAADSLSNTFFVAARRDHQHRRHPTQCSRVLIHALGGLYAVQPWHQPIQQHQLVGVAGGGGLLQLHQPFLTTRTGIGPHAKVLQHAGKHGAGAVVVVNHQHTSAFQVVRMGLDRRLFTAHHQGHHQLKPAALARGGRDFDAPAHQLGQLPANGQPQTTATKPSGDGTIDLRERAEQLWQPLSRNAHARVGHAENQLHCTGRNGPLGCLGNRLSIDVLIGLRHTHVQHNFTFFCELHGVVGQVRQHLTEPQRVALQAARYVLVNQQQQLQAFFLRFQRHQVGHVVQHLVELERNGLQSEFARFNAGIVQHVVDQAQQSARTTAIPFPGSRAAARPAGFSAEACRGR
jgi:hypothetical protein